ncbi:hypothetical protein [Aliivibrio fischeri]|uniref:hypothetical protein n=1 Tax=Aliivibrio fischeri TaxID=668 RepID=UPI00105DA091|nr:hypothetical protein [Aliivibrio fischeri]TDM56046.1 hypothetical protein VFFQA001_01005 [Aliivibrio fischeri]
MTVYKEKLKCGAEVIWSVPLSGFGHVADEQPLPYIHFNGIELTPRYGAEEALIPSSIQSLPLPYGKLKKNWPIQQRLFNLTRKKINIYWRNLFKTFCRKDKMFYFLEQLQYKSIIDGFVGESPLIKYTRKFEIGTDWVIVRDRVFFKKKMEFDYCHISPICFFEDCKNIDIIVSLQTNYKKEVSSSTGKAICLSKKNENITFKNNEVLMWEYKYILKDGVYEKK